MPEEKMKERFEYGESGYEVKASGNPETIEEFRRVLKGARKIIRDNEDEKDGNK